MKNLLTILILLVYSITTAQKKELILESDSFYYTNEYGLKIEDKALIFESTTIYIDFKEKYLNIKQNNNVKTFTILRKHKIDKLTLKIFIEDSKGYITSCEYVDKYNFIFIKEKTLIEFL
jgi:hypothetical protein